MAKLRIPSLKTAGKHLANRTVSGEELVVLYSELTYKDLIQRDRNKIEAES